MKPFFFGEKMEFINYLITDPKYYGDDKIEFENILDKNLKNHQVEFASFRDKLSENRDELVNVFLEVCDKYDIKMKIINSDVDLAIKLCFNGIHLTSKQFDKIRICKDNGLYVIISCHDFEEIKNAYENGADAVTFSPIFYTPYKGKPKGIESLKSIINRVKEIKTREFKIIGLGGIIDSEHIEQIKSAEADGFASIRYFIN